MKISSYFIKEWEKFERNAYWDPTGKVWTIGYGSTFNPFTMEKVKDGDTVSEELAVQWLNKYVADNAPVFPGAAWVTAAACESFIFNVGISAFNKSTLRKLLLQNCIGEELFKQCLRWTRSGGKTLRGLVYRRRFEGVLAGCGHEIVTPYSVDWEKVSRELRKKCEQTGDFAELRGWLLRNANKL